MTAAPHLAASNEAHWTGMARVWAHVQQYPPRKERSSWLLVVIGLVLIAMAIGALK